MKRIIRILLALSFICFYSNVFAQNKQPVRAATSYLLKAVGWTKKEIIKYYQDGTNRFKIEDKYGELGFKMTVIHHHNLRLNYYINSDTCVLLKIYPGDAAESLSKLNDSLYARTKNNCWVIQFSPILYMSRIVDSKGDFFIVYNEDFLNHVKSEKSETDSQPDSGIEYQMPVYGGNEFYDGYQIADFARQVGFKPRNYTFEEWENAVITVFSNKQGSSANSRQINIEAMNLCERQSDVMYRRYTGLYGFISKLVFDKYCRLFIILLKTDAIKR